MKSTLQSAKFRLNGIIDEMAENPMLFVKEPKKDFTRNRKLGFAAMLKILISMGGGTLKKELLDFFAYSPETASSSAFTQQRDKILPLAFEFLLHEFTDTASCGKTYDGYRLLAVDGTSLSIAHNPSDSDTYFQSTPDTKGFNLLHMNALYDLQSRLYLDACVQPGRKENENRAFTDMVDRSKVQGQVIVMADRNYESYNAFAHLERKNWNYVIRVKDLGSKSIISSLDLPDSGEFDLPINLVLTRKQTKKTKAEPKLYKFLPKNSTFDFLDLHENKYFPLSFRVVRFLLPTGEYEAVITNLDSVCFPKEKIRELYHLRWDIETSFRQLKYAISLVNFHAKKAEHILQEIFARLLMYNFCEMIASSAVTIQKNTKYSYQVNFTATVLVCRRFLRSDMPPLDAEALISRFVLPVRPGRSDPRKVKTKSAISFNYRIA